MVLGYKKWRKTRRGIMRGDVDAHFDPRNRQCGVGVVAIDHEGRLVAPLAKPSPSSSTPLMEEIMAFVYGLVFCVEKGMVVIELFTDSVLAARVMADSEKEGLLLSDDICDSIRAAREHFLLHIFHTYKSANSVAHILASRAFNSSHSLCWYAVC